MEDLYTEAGMTNRLNEAKVQFKTVRQAMVQDWQTEAGKCALMAVISRQVYRWQLPGQSMARNFQV